MRSCNKEITVRIAIIGAGLAGLALCWHLKQKSHVAVTLFDAKGIGGGASGAATGLLHPFIGAQANLSWPAFAGMEETQKLLAVAQKEVQPPIIQATGIFRPASSPQQENAFYARSQEYSDIIFWQKEKCGQMLPACHAACGLFLPQGLCIDTPLYLQGLWSACQKLGAIFIQEKILDLSALSDYDAIAIATGSETCKLPQTQNAPLSLIKGQTLLLQWPQNIPPLRLPVNGKKYLVMHPSFHSCLVGATYEHHFHSDEPDLTAAREQLLPAVQNMMLALGQTNILQVKAGIRAAAPQKQLPLVGQIASNIWLFVGLGSRGLLQHAYIGRMLAEAMVAQNDQLLPLELRRSFCHLM